MKSNRLQLVTSLFFLFFTCKPNAPIKLQPNNSKQAIEENQGKKSQQSPKKEAPKKQASLWQRCAWTLCQCSTSLLTNAAAVFGTRTYGYSPNPLKKILKTAFFKTIFETGATAVNEYQKALLITMGMEEKLLKPKDTYSNGEKFCNEYFVAIGKVIGNSKGKLVVGMQDAEDEQKQKKLKKAIKTSTRKELIQKSLEHLLIKGSLKLIPLYKNNDKFKKTIAWLTNEQERIEKLTDDLLREEVSKQSLLINTVAFFTYKDRLEKTHENAWVQATFNVLKVLAKNASKNTLSCFIPATTEGVYCLFPIYDVKN